MAIDRRGLLAGLGATLVGTSLPRGPARAQDGARQVMVSAYGRSDGGFGIAGLDGTSGAKLFDVPLPGRGHGMVARPGRNEIVVFARRPGGFAVALDAASGEVLYRMTSAPGRHFYGHGAFSRDGRLLYTTENDFEAGRGMLGVRDAADGYRIVGEMPSHGVGPHELKLMGDGRTLAVANGGAQTHPDFGRAKLNIPIMTPSLSYLEAESGKLLGDYHLPAARHQLSIRHIDVAADDTVAIALQYEGPGEDRIGLLAADRGAWRAMRNYCGSVGFDRSGKSFAVSSPRGGIITLWDKATRRLLGRADIADGSGLAAAEQPGQFLATSGQGGAWRLSPEDPAEALPDLVAGRRWDNHLLVVRPERMGFIRLDESPHKMNGLVGRFT